MFVIPLYLVVYGKFTQCASKQDLFFGGAENTNKMEQIFLVKKEKSKIWKLEIDLLNHEVILHALSYGVLK